MTEQIEIAPLADATRERYLRYALSVITSRALPDVRDGLKPVQRRILYAMQHDFGLGGRDAKPRKCAEVVGGVMGVYHPHGDQAIYEALVRMAQDFSLRYPFVDGQGNFGTIHGDPPAAFRYTECRLQPIAAELMALLGEETVPFRPNYSAKTEEPVVLPVPAPFLLANGATGIAVGMATNIPPHHLGELCRAAALLVDDPDTNVAQLMKHVRGPDFPTGGDVLTKKAELKEIYETGKGSFKVRGTWKLEEGSRGARALIFTSIPYGTTLQTVLGAIAEIIRLKKIPHAQDVRDETTDTVRIVVELKKDADPHELVAYLFKHTPLQANYGVNMTCLVPTENPLIGRPVVLDLKAQLRHFLDFRFDVVTKSLRFRLKKLDERIHVLEGFEVLFEDLDGAIRLIRKAQDKADAAAKLMKRYALDALQTEAILELKLYKLAALEVEAIQTELAEKRTEAKRLAKLLKTDAPRWEIVKKDLVAFAETHDTARKTKIVVADDASLAYDEEAYIAKEDTNVVVTRLGLLKRVRKLEDPTSTRVKDDDQVSWIVQGSTRSEVVFFSSQGSAYVAKLVDAPATTGYGDPIQKLFKFGDGERVVQVLGLDRRITRETAPAKGPAAGAAKGRDSDPPEPHLLVATAGGYVLRVPLLPHREVSTRSGRKFARVDEGDEVVSVELVPAKKGLSVLVVTKSGLAQRFPLDDAPLVQGVGKGRLAFKLERGDRVLAATTAPSIELETTRGGRDTIAQKDVALGERGGEALVVKRRFGFERAVTPPPVVRELEPEPDEGEGKRS